MTAADRPDAPEGAPEGAPEDHADAKLNELRRQLLGPTLNNAVFTGFTATSLEEGALDAGAAAGDAAIAWPNGIDDVLAFWSSEADAASGAYLAGEGATGRIRDRVAGAVVARIDYFAPHKEAARRAANMLALPPRQALAARLTWRAADAIWRGLGDSSTDFNFYSKRAILSAVVSSTHVRWLADEDPEWTATRDFLAARIENVMQFEKLKARFKDSPFDPSAFLRTAAKARYRNS